jgi:uncharacterized protein (TIGR03435 family)
MTRQAFRPGWLAVTCAATVLAMLPSTAGLAQAPAFKTATVTPSMAGEGQRRGGVRLEPGGKFGARNATLKQLIDAAYWRHAYDKREIRGGPDWIDTAAFDLAADAGREHVFDTDGFTPDTVLMLRTLLVERFKLKIRTENEPRPVYALTLANADGALGPNLRKSDIDIAATVKIITAGGRPEKPMGIATYPGRMKGNAVSMPSLASILSGGVVDRPVIDRTGLKGIYDYVFEAVEIKAAGPFGPSYNPSDTKESIFTTLPKQLGLKLEPVEGTVEVLVVEHAEMPAAPSAK